MSKVGHKQTAPETPAVVPGRGNPLVKWGPSSAVAIGFLASIMPSILLALVVAAIALARGSEVEALLETTTPLQELGLSVMTAAVSLSIIYLYVEKRGGWTAIGFTKIKPQHFKLAAAGFAGYILFFQAVFVLLESAFPSFESDEAQSTFIDGQESIAVLAAGFLALVIIAPLVEEILYRGFAFQGLAKAFGYFPAAFVTSALFGLAHFQLNVAIDTFILGMIAAWLVWKTNSIWPAILLHGAKNLLAFILRFFIL